MAKKELSVEEQSQVNGGTGDPAPVGDSQLVKHPAMAWVVLLEKFRRRLGLDSKIAAGRLNMTEENGQEEKHPLKRPSTRI